LSDQAGCPAGRKSGPGGTGADDQHTEGGWHHIEPFGDILTDLVERAAAARASLVLDINDLFDPLEVRGQ
jgi:hypothetical protein